MNSLLCISGKEVRSCVHPSFFIFSLFSFEEQENGFENVKIGTIAMHASVWLHEYSLIPWLFLKFYQPEHLRPFDSLWRRLQEY